MVGGGTPLCSRASRIHDWPGRTCRKEAGTSWIATCGIIEAIHPFYLLVYSTTEIWLWVCQPVGHHQEHVWPCRPNQQEMVSTFIQNSDARTPQLSIFSRVLISMQHMKPSTSLVPTSMPLLSYPRVASWLDASCCRRFSNSEGGCSFSDVMCRNVTSPFI